MSDDESGGIEGIDQPRPYCITQGRTQPCADLELMTHVCAIGGNQNDRSEFRMEYAEALRWCQLPTSVAEIASRMRQPASAVKVVIADLVVLGKVRVAAPKHAPPSLDVLERVLDGLTRLQYT
ncbi:hypothetical protein FHU38_000197 [Saccharomonospora amisosensis]|uniref:DUF742 domain-containing protein n=2 Tax=Saccharomonospora TaxID=1851 RepID=H5X604_9PSEU|nr:MULTISPECIES: DUF742 domain-containing protein [Saccharomonospora]EHR53403.1 Protein of unknown function (DUF742) [Saccharomonospora marina XMU15]NIJ09853.1 hypothetical protein [Saccharomonospora amisosensis]